MLLFAACWVLASSWWRCTRARRRLLRAGAPQKRPRTPHAPTGTARGRTARRGPQFAVWAAVAPYIVATRDGCATQPPCGQTKGNILPFQGNAPYPSAHLWLRQLLPPRAGLARNAMCLHSAKAWVPLWQTMHAANEPPRFLGGLDLHCRPRGWSGRGGRRTTEFQTTELDGTSTPWPVWEIPDIQLASPLSSRSRSPTGTSPETSTRSSLRCCPK